MACFLRSGEQTRQAQEKKELIKSVLVVKPQTKKLSLTLTEGVTLAPEESGIIASEVTSTLTKWHVRENDVVKAGAPIATLDDTDTRLSLEQARAGLAALKAQYARILKDYERMKALLAGGSIPQANFDAIEAEKTALASQIESGEKSLKLLQRRVSKTVIRAPFDGVITKKLVPLGKYIMATMPGGGDIATIDKIDRLKASFSISEMYYAEVAEGQTVRFKIPTMNQTVEGLIASKGKSINTMKTFSLISYLDNGTNAVPAGVFSVATLKTPEKERIIVPPTAVNVTGTRMGEVFSIKDGKVVKTPISIGFTFEEGLEVNGEIPAAIIKDVSNIKVGETVKAIEG